MTARGNDPTVGPPAWWSGVDSPGQSDGDIALRKQGLRRLLLAARRALSPEAVAERDHALTAAAVGLATGVAGPIGAYLPIGSEPGGPHFVDALAAAGVEVLLPVVAGSGPLDWARHDGWLERGPLGLREPAGPRLGPDAITFATLVLVPAVAVDRRGVRLGRGGGFYDRTLASTTGLVVAVVGNGELVERLPASAHDQPVPAALLPDAGLVVLGKNT